MGSAFKNKGVQAALDGVVHFLPNPYEVENLAFDQSQKEAKVALIPDSKKPAVALAFKLEEGQFGQLTYLRVYQGTLKRGDQLLDVNTGNRIKIPRLVRMHSSIMENINDVGAGNLSIIVDVNWSVSTATFFICILIR
jgi:elongation factor G